MKAAQLLPSLLLAAALCGAKGIAPPAARGQGPIERPASKLEKGPRATLKSIDVDLGGGVSIALLLIPAGAFSMGSDSERAHADDGPAHRVTISKPFYLGKYEVTQEQWEALMGSNPSSVKRKKSPVDMVSWDDCQKFVGKLQAKAPRLRWHLPTEAQWEYACRAGSTTEYFFGNDANRLAEFAWYDMDYDSDRAREVGTKRPNAWGLYDMQGNVSEWCFDLYGRYPEGPQTDPRGATETADQGLRVTRGLNWHDVNASHGRSAVHANRFAPPYASFKGHGFRVAAAAE